MPPSVVIVGAGGLLGQALTRAAATWPGLEAVALTHARLDIGDAEAVRRTLGELTPSVVINAAAYTDVDGAERDPAAAEHTNSAAVATLARETARAGCGLVHLSTDHVFDGRRREPYQPGDATGPVNAYGRSKLAGEEWIRRLQPTAWIVRTAGLFGDGGRNFVAAIARRALAGQPLRVVDDQVCCRTYAADLAASLLEGVTRGVPCGTYHVTNAGAGSWYEFACAIVERLNVAVAVTPVSSAEYGAPAPRPAYSVLDGAAWTAAGRTAPRPVGGALDAYLSRLAAGAGQEQGDA